MSKIRSMDGERDSRAFFRLHYQKISCFPIPDIRSILNSLGIFCWSAGLFEGIINSQLHEFLLHSLSSLGSAG